MSSRLQVQVVTVGQTDFSLLEKMNIQCDVLIGNQGMTENTVARIQYRGHDAVMYSWREIGVGLNRNNLMMRSDAEIVLFSDDDVVYDDGYVDTVLDAFDHHPEADGIFFDVIPLPETIAPCLNGSWRRIGMRNCLRYGAPRLAVRGKILKEKNICFSLLFGGGAKYSSGEDSLFIFQMMRSGVKFYACPKKIGTVSFTNTWFTGYDEKYFRDKGVFFYLLSHRYFLLFCLQYCIRKQPLFAETRSWRSAFSLMLEGVRQYRKET